MYGAVATARLIGCRLPCKCIEASLRPGSEGALCAQELLLKLVEDNYPLATDPDAVPGEILHLYNGQCCSCKADLLLWWGQAKGPDQRCLNLLGSPPGCT